MTASFAISDLRTRRAFAAAVADRVWRAWWEPKGHPLAFVEGLVARNLGPEPIPFALVAHDGDAFLGTVSGIASDLDARPRFAPWVAALWVEPEHRTRGVGTALLRACAGRLLEISHPRAHLCAMPHRHGFYEARGWRVVERGVDGDGLAVFAYP